MQGVVVRSCDSKSKNWLGEVQGMRELLNSKRFSLKLK